MKIRLSVSSYFALHVALSLTLASTTDAEQQTAKLVVPATGSTALCTVDRQRYIHSDDPTIAPSVDVTYMGNGLRRREIHSTTEKSDLAATMKVRYSDDNGRHWTPFVSQPGSEDEKQNGNGLERLSFAVQHHPESSTTIEMQFQRVFVGDAAEAIAAHFRGGEPLFFDHGFYRLSSDDGRTWTQLRQLKYEGGPDFDPDDWANPEYLKTNKIYGGYDVVALRDGRIAYPVVVPVPYQDDEEDRKVCKRVPWFKGEGFVAGVRCFFGTWNPAKGDFDWTHSEPVSVPRRVSTRGLTEPSLAELVDGTLLLVMRGSNKRLDPSVCPGRKWISTSKDGGKTWSQVSDLRFDTGEQFYSPSAFSKMLRSSKTNKLYWVGNISDTPPKGNAPRYPLVIAEIDEANVALRKDTLTTIDARGESDTAELQLSNFSLLEDRETKQLEIYLTRYGEQADNINHADSYKYTLSFK